MNSALPVSPVLPVTVTVYPPPGTFATTKDPDATPPAIWQTGFGGVEIRPLGDVVIIHGPSSPAAKPVPET